LEATKKYPADVTTTNLPIDKMAGHYRQIFLGFDKIDQFKVTKEDNTEFDAAPPLIAAVTLPSNLGAQVWCINAVCPHPDGYTITGTNLAANVGSNVTGIKSGQQFYIVLRAAASGALAGKYDVDVYYRKYDTTNCTGPLYGWTAVDVTAQELYDNFNLFIGKEGTFGPELLDAANYYNIITASALGLDL
jgi:hypothetical protein